MNVLGWLADVVPPDVTPSLAVTGPWQLSNVQSLDPAVPIPGLGLGYKFKEITNASSFHGILVRANFAEDVVHTIVMLAKPEERAFFCFDHWDGAKDFAHNFVMGTPGLGKPYQDPLLAPYAKAVKSGWGLYAAQFKGTGIANQVIGVYDLKTDDLAAHAGEDGKGFLIGRLGVWDTAFTAAELDAYVAKAAARIT